MDGSLRPFPVLARCVQAAIAATTAADVYRAIATRDHALHRTPEAVDSYDSALALYGNLLTVTVALFLMWLVRARRRAQDVSPRAALPSTGWTLGAWFIPIVNLFVPPRIVLSIGRASTESWRERRDTTLVNLWWGAWIAHTVLLPLGRWGATESITVLVAAEAFIIAAAVLAVLVVERITVLQRSPALNPASAAQSPGPN
ncbi:DUF4328 domain-containing protein [Streptomyces sp. NPDC097595]|uniref:DUF4328 domain-containing protein n=1 Tax=Streptomyces sp. NPDC097595 TaxID=3366090 RepID=UPI0038226B1C